MERKNSERMRRVGREREEGRREMTKIRDRDSGAGIGQP
jgi:hypothetical protein